jgi:uncharacterized membrane protein
MAATENIIVGTFAEESKTYQAFSEIKQLATRNPEVRIEGLAIVRRKADGSLETPDMATKGYNSSFKGGLLGSLVGILGGPIGMLLGWGTGAVIGGLRDAGEIREDYQLLQRLTEQMKPGQVALVGHVKESSNAPINDVVRRLGGELLRRPSAEIERELENAAREHAAGGGDSAGASAS